MEIQSQLDRAISNTFEEILSFGNIIELILSCDIVNSKFIILHYLKIKHNKYVCNNPQILYHISNNNIFNILIIFIKDNLIILESIDINAIILYIFNLYCYGHVLEITDILEVICTHKLIHMYNADIIFEKLIEILFYEGQYDLLLSMQSKDILISYDVYTIPQKQCDPMFLLNDKVLQFDLLFLVGRFDNIDSMCCLFEHKKYNIINYFINNKNKTWRLLIKELFISSYTIEIFYNNIDIKPLISEFNHNDIDELFSYIYSRNNIEKLNEPNQIDTMYDVLSQIPCNNISNIVFKNIVRTLILKNKLQCFRNYEKEYDIIKKLSCNILDFKIPTSVLRNIFSTRYQDNIYINIDSLTFLITKYFETNQYMLFNILPQYIFNLVMQDIHVYNFVQPYEYKHDLNTFGKDKLYICTMVQTGKDYLYKKYFYTKLIIIEDLFINIFKKIMGIESNTIHIIDINNIDTSNNKINYHIDKIGTICKLQSLLYKPIEKINFDA